MRNQFIGEIQKSGTNLLQELEKVKTMAYDFEVKKADKRDIIEVRQLINQGLENKADMQEIQNALNRYNSEQT